VEVVGQNYKVAARLKDKAVTFSGDGKFRFGDIEFETGVFASRKCYVRLRLCSAAITVTDLVDLFLILENSGIIAESSSRFDV